MGMENRVGSYEGVLTLGEMREGEIHAVSYELLAWGRDLADKLGVELASIIVGHDAQDKGVELIHRGADKAYVVDNPALENFLADPYSKILISIIKEYKPEIFIASATTMGKIATPLGFTGEELLKLAGYLPLDETDARVEKIKAKLKAELITLTAYLCKQIDRY